MWRNYLPSNLPLLTTRHRQLKYISLDIPIVPIVSLIFLFSFSLYFFNFIFLLDSLNFKLNPNLKGGDNMPDLENSLTFKDYCLLRAFLEKYHLDILREFENKKEENYKELVEDVAEYLK